MRSSAPQCGEKVGEAGRSSSRRLRAQQKCSPSAFLVRGVDKPKTEPGLYSRGINKNNNDDTRSLKRCSLPRSEKSTPFEKKHNGSSSGTRRMDDERDPVVRQCDDKLIFPLGGGGLNVHREGNKNKANKTLQTRRTPQRAPVARATAPPKQLWPFPHTAACRVQKHPPTGTYYAITPSHPRLVSKGKRNAD